MAPVPPTVATPACGGLPARDLSFAREPIGARWYMGGDPVPSLFLSALSATFPLGERFFIDAVRRFGAELDDELGRVVDAFVVQEALHTREHLKFNQLIAATGYRTAALTGRTRAALAPFRAMPAVRQLGLTMALEHLTALFAHEVLAVDARLAPAPAEVRALWRWHALEEIEHKAVAFDVYRRVARDWSGPRRYGFRARAMIEATRVLASVVARNMDDLREQDELSALSFWIRALAYFLGRRGVVTSMMPGYLRWFAPGFHPDRIEDRHLAERAASELPDRARIADDGR